MILSLILDNFRMKGIHFVQIHRAKSTFHHRGIVWNERSSIHRFSHSSPLKKKKKKHDSSTLRRRSDSLLSSPSKTKQKRSLPDLLPAGKSWKPWSIESPFWRWNASFVQPFVRVSIYPLSSPLLLYPLSPNSPLHTVPFCFHFPPLLSSIPLLFSSSLFVHPLSRSIHTTLYRSLYLDSKVRLT